MNDDTADPAAVASSVPVVTHAPPGLIVAAVSTVYAVSSSWVSVVVPDTDPPATG
ncbi:hypothetical protein J0H58_06590 [bacterium]|nr:hypothetical protein [bacterium]